MKYQWRECAAPSLTHIKPRQIAAGYDHLFERYCPKADKPTRHLSLYCLERTAAYW